MACTTSPLVCVSSDVAAEKILAVEVGTYIGQATCLVSHPALFCDHGQGLKWIFLQTNMLSTIDLLVLTSLD
jgi:hypothetical protein